MIVRCAKELQEGSLFILGLAEEADGTGRSLVLQTDSREPETHCLSTADGRTEYDAIEGWSIVDDTLTLQLATRAASSLGLPVALYLQLDPGAVDANAVRGAMSRFRFDRQSP